MSLFGEQAPRSVAADSPWLAPYDGSLKADGLHSSAARKGFGIGNPLKKVVKQIEPLNAPPPWNWHMIFSGARAYSYPGVVK
jgi:hypothetical protein